jgi:hypothetical protein
LHFVAKKCERDLNTLSYIFKNRGLRVSKIQIKGCSSEIEIELS